MSQALKHALLANVVGVVLHIIRKTTIIRRHVVRGVLKQLKIRLRMVHNDPEQNCLEVNARL